MKLYIKQLQSQESGYSGDTPNQRGKYILIPKESWGEFPRLSELTFNDARPLVVNTQRGRVAVSYVWHNAAFHTDWLGDNIRKHDERRIYRNNAIDEVLNLDRYVILILGIDSTGEVYATTIQVGDKDYADWSALALASKGKCMDQSVISPELFSACGLREVLNRAEVDKRADLLPPSISGVSEVTKNLADITTKRVQQRGRHQQEPDPGDPAAMLLPVIQSQQDFAKVVRDMYGGFCCIRESRLVTGSTVGLEAAHVRAYSDAGPNLPSNGILLSGDLHRAFDVGAFTLSLDHKVEIHGAVDSSSQLWSFDQKQIKPKHKAFEAFLPFGPYVEWHRERVFGDFVR